jgi:CRISPR-associated protein Cas8c/Csd1, subtype I-C/DVULG
MILQALVAHYEDLLARGDIPRPGWGNAKVSYALYLDDSGTLTQVGSTKTEQLRGKKTVVAPREMRVPAPVKKTSGKRSNFLWENSGYILGIKKDEDPTRSIQCYECCKTLHHKILDDVDNPAAKALLQFFDSWNPEKAAEHPALQEDWDEVISGGNLIFCYEGQFLQDIPDLAAAWERHYLSAGDGPEMTCLVTGNRGPAEAVHPSIKGIRGAQSSGAALVSFNEPAFCSYGKKQNFNAPTSQYASFAYTTALNHLINDREHVQYIGDTAVLCWAAGAEPAYQGMMGLSLLGNSKDYSQQDILDKVSRLAKGLPVEFEQSRLDPKRPFYVLGIAPNAARLSVRFFLRDSFGQFMGNVLRHHQRLEIIRPSYDSFSTLPLWKLLGETVNQKAKDKSASPEMAGDVLRAILMDSRYPASLLNGVNLRIRAEHELTRGRAAIIKAYYLKNVHPDVPKEVLQVSLNPDSTSIPYQLGRLFSILENIQSAANPGINATIKDKYFNSASATPATVFPVLVNLAQKHLRKIGGGLQVILEKNMSEIMGKLGEDYPTRLNLAQQGAFQLGYYHQTQARYQGRNKEV